MGNTQYFKRNKSIEHGLPKTPPTTQHMYLTDQDDPLHGYIPGEVFDTDFSDTSQVQYLVLKDDTDNTNNQIDIVANGQYIVEDLPQLQEQPTINPATELDLYNGCTDLAKTIEKNISDKMQSYCKGSVTKEILSYTDNYVKFGVFLMENCTFHVVSEYYHILRRINSSSVKVLQKIYEINLLDEEIDDTTQTKMKFMIAEVTNEWGCLFQFSMSFDLVSKSYFNILKQDFETTIENIKMMISIKDKKMSDFEFTWKLRIEQIKNRCYLPAQVFDNKKNDEYGVYYGRTVRWFHKKPTILYSQLCDKPELPQYMINNCLKTTQQMNFKLTNQVSELLLTN